MAGRRWPWSRRRTEVPPQLVAPDDPRPAIDGPIAYVVLTVDNRWLACLCADREEALAVMQRLYDLGADCFAGQAESLACAHWQLRQALRVFVGGGIGPMPWTGYPNSRSTGGQGMNVVALRDSFERAIDADAHLAEHFYQRLFNMRPDLRAYFPADMRAQEAALGAKLVDIMLHLEDAAYLASHLAALGARHAERYRVAPDMFDPVVDALINTLEQAVGGWGDQRGALRGEWMSALGAVRDLMLAGFPQMAS